MNNEAQITRSQVMEWAKTEIAKEGDDFVYEANRRGGESSSDCYYFEDGVPSCLVGRMLYNNGVITEPFEDDDYENTNRIGSLIKEFNVNFTPAARLFLTFLQRDQDSGIPWGVAYNHAAMNS